MSCIVTYQVITKRSFKVLASSAYLRIRTISSEIEFAMQGGLQGVLPPLACNGGRRGRSDDDG